MIHEMSLRPVDPTEPTLPAGRPSPRRGSGEACDWRATDPALFEAIEWHLLRAQLTPTQGRSLETHGWFDVVWRAQCLVLRVYADRFPTVDAHQLGTRAGYLCSFDVRSAAPLENERARFSGDSRSAAGAARRVMEAHRRGMLKTLLEAADQVQVTR